MTTRYEICRATPLAPPDGPTDPGGRTIAIFVFLPVACVAWLMTLLGFLARTEGWDAVRIVAPVVGTIATLCYLRALRGRAGWLMRLFGGACITVAGLVWAGWLVWVLFTEARLRAAFAAVFAFGIAATGVQVLRSAFRRPGAPLVPEEEDRRSHPMGRPGSVWERVPRGPARS